MVTTALVELFNRDLGALKKKSIHILMNPNYGLQVPISKTVPVIFAYISAAIFNISSALFLVTPATFETVMKSLAKRMSLRMKY